MNKWISRLSLCHIEIFQCTSAVISIQKKYFMAVWKNSVIVSQHLFLHEADYSSYIPPAGKSKCDVNARLFVCWICWKKFRRRWDFPFHEPVCIWVIVFKVQSLGSRSLRLFINDNNNCKQSNSINNILVNNESKS